MSDILHTPEAKQAFDDLLGTLAESLQAAKEATQQAERLRTENARKDRIILEKVAAAKPVATRALVEELVSSMCDHGLSKQADSQDLIEQFLAHPDNLVKLASQLAIVSMPAPRQGVGIAKEASATKHSDPDQDGWGNVIRNGA